MFAGIYITYSELFDRQPTLAELVELIKPLPLRHAAYNLSLINLALRYAMQEPGRTNFGEVQKKLVGDHLNDETFALFEQRFPKTNPVERPVFLPQTILAILRLVLIHCDPEPQPKIDEDRFVRCTIGTACLMMNNLLLTVEEQQALLATTTEDERRIELMVQAMAGFEVANTASAEHLIRRLQVMYLLLLKKPDVTTRLALRFDGFDFEREFYACTHVQLEQWLFVILTLYAFFLHGGNFA